MLTRFEQKDDFQYMITKYENCCIIENYKGLARVAEEKRKDHWLMTFENYISIPGFYDFDFMKTFKGIITHNKKIFEIYRDKLNIKYIEYPQFNDYYNLIYFRPFEEKIKGIVCPSRIYPSTTEGSILYLREDFMNDFKTPLLKHVFSDNKWGDQNKGVIYQHDFSDPYSEKSLDIKNKYLFVLALEPVYHPIWSYSWITERLLCCFRAKSIPLFFGTYNIEDYIPDDIYVDLRKYLIQTEPKITFDYKRLNDDLLEIANDKQRYNTMIEKAYQWQLNNKFGEFNKIEKQIDKIVEYKEGNVC